MTVSPLKIITPQVEIDEEVVRMAREFLAKAESGEFNGIIIIATRPDGTWCHEYSGSEKFTAQIGKIEIIKQDLIARYNEEFE